MSLLQGAIRFLSDSKHGICARPVLGGSPTQVGQVVSFSPLPRDIGSVVALCVPACVATIAVLSPKWVRHLIRARMSTSIGAIRAGVSASFLIYVAVPC